ATRQRSADERETTSPPYAEADCAASHLGVTSQRSAPAPFCGAESHSTQAMPALAKSTRTFLLPISQAVCWPRSGSWHTSSKLSASNFKRHFASFFDDWPGPSCSHVSNAEAGTWRTRASSSAVCTARRNGLVRI